MLNNFTKDELEYIKNYIFDGAASIRHRHHEILKDKIQSMIESHCDHNWDNDCCGCMPEAVFCTKCDFRLVEPDKEEEDE